MKKRYFLMGILLVVFILITTLVVTNNISSFDDNIYNMIFSIRNNFLDLFFKTITLCANTIPIICICVYIL